MADKIDPYDVAALEKSVNDSATRVSAIWVSFLIFSLYLLITAGTVQHRQLFLAESLKLPVLNIDMPLWWFFVLAPVLFVIFHAYVLLQVLLLGRTSLAYNQAVEKAVKQHNLRLEEGALLRQRLANTLFAQIFAGSSREREGWLGGLLHAMAWITLAIGPIFILTAFQFAFLPYHSHFATWTHRTLILVELVAFFLIWPLAIDARRDFDWPTVWIQFSQKLKLAKPILTPKESKRYKRLSQRAILIISCLFYVLVALSLATFPGEPHVNLFTGNPLTAVECNRWVSQKVDRLVLPDVEVIDDEKFDKIEGLAAKRGRPPTWGKRAWSFRGRDLSCGYFVRANLRRTDFTFAQMTGVTLAAAELQGANLLGAVLRRSNLQAAQLQNSDLGGARLEGADLSIANLQNAHLNVSRLQGAELWDAELQGAILAGTKLQGANLRDAKLPGAVLRGAHLQGANLSGARLEGTQLAEAELQGADFEGAKLHGASLERAQLQGAKLDQSVLSYTRISNASVWRAKNAACQDARVVQHKPDAILGTSDFIERSVGEIPDGKRKDEARKRMRAGLVVDPDNDDTAAIEEAWSKCEKASTEPSQRVFDQKFDQNHANFLRKLVCDDVRNGKAIAKGIVLNWISAAPDRRDFSARLARGLLAQDGEECPGANDLDESIKELLREFVLRFPSTQVPPSIQQ